MIQSLLNQAINDIRNCLTEALRAAAVAALVLHPGAAAALPPFGPEHYERARQVANFLRAHGYWDDREFVTVEIDGITFVIIDIGMRMLTPRERFTAQGFRSNYIIDRAASWRTVRRSNSPPSSRAICAGIPFARPKPRI